MRAIAARCEPLGSLVGRIGGEVAAVEADMADLVSELEGRPDDGEERRFERPLMEPDEPAFGAPLR